MKRSLLAMALFTSACARSGAPTPASSPDPKGPPSLAASAVAARRPARPADIGSIDAVVGALYDSVSGPPGPRDWDRVRSLFAPGAWVAPVRHGADGVATAQIMSIEAFIERASRNVREDGFYEKEIARRTEEFGSIVHVFSTYESRHSLDDARPFTRGINSIQLLRDGNRYWIVSVYWDTEREGVLLPDKYVPSR